MSARRAFGSLMLLALGLLAGASALAGYLGIPDAHVSVAEAGAWCVQTIQFGLAQAHVPKLAEKILSAVLAAMLLAGLASAAYCAWLTQNSLRRLCAKPLQLPPRISRRVEQLGLTGRVMLYDSDRLFSFCHGLIRPRICLSRGLIEALDDESVSAVLAHERHHLRQADPLRAALSTVLAAAAFPLPLVASLRRVHLAAREIEADRAAVLAVGQTPLARALLTVMRHPDTLRLSPRAAIGAFDPESCRIAHLTQPGQVRPPRVSRRSLLASLFALALLAGLVLPTASDPIHASAAQARPAFAKVDPSCTRHGLHCKRNACAQLCESMSVFGARCANHPPSTGAMPHAGSITPHDH